MSGKPFLAAALLIMAAACTQERAESPVLSSEKMSFVVSIDGTKVSFDNYKLAWEPEDEIIVVHNENYYHQGTFKYAEGLEGGKARFEGEDLDIDGPFYALWPAQQVSYAIDDFFRVTFYKEQTVPAGGVDASHLYLHGYGDGELHFRPAVGLLKFTVKRPDIRKISISSNKTAKIAVDPEDDNSVYVSNETGELYIPYSGDNEVIVIPAEGCFQTGEPYYVSMIPATLEKGICMTLVNEKEEEAFKFSFNALPIEAGKVTNLGEIDAEFNLSDLPESIVCDKPIGYNYDWSGDPYCLRRDASFDLGSLVRVLPESADQRVAYIPLDDRLTVSPEGIVSASSPVTAAVKIVSLAKPSCSRTVYFGFTGVVQDGIYYYIDTEYNTAIVTNDTFSFKHSAGVYSGTVVVPASINVDGTEYEVIIIQDYAFEDCPDLVKVVLPEGLTGIGVSAFDNCPSLEEVNLPSTLVYMLDVDSNSLAKDCPRLSITSLSPRFPVDDYGNLYEDSSDITLLWLCEKTTGTNVIKEGTTEIGSGDGPMYNSFARAIQFPTTLEEPIWVSSFNGGFPNLEEIIVDFTSYEEFESIFHYFRKDSGYSKAGIFGRLRNHNEDVEYPVKLSVPADCASKYSSAVADYGFSEVITH